MCGEEFATESGMKVHHAKIHSKSIAGEGRECEHCGQTFQYKASDGRGRFCSHECALSNRSKQKTVLCECCGRDYQVPECRVSTTRFCSRECHGSWWNHDEGVNSIARVELNCDMCGGSFTVHECRADSARFCGRDCYASWRSECVVGQSHPCWEGGRPSYGSGWNENKKERVRERDGRTCQECGRGEAEHIELFGRKHSVHHIEKARTFDDPSERNAMENLITLCCGECHQTWERMAPLRPHRGD